MRRHGLVSSSLVTFGLALACGGGGSGSGSGEPAEINAANAEEVAAQVVTGIDLSAEFSRIGGGLAGGILPGAATTAEAGGSFDAIAAAISVALGAAGDGLPSLPGAGGITPSAAFDPITVNCDMSGTVTVSGNIADPDAVTPGDRINGSFDECVNEDDGGDPLPELDGRLGFTVLAITGDLEELFSLILDLSLNEFTMNDGVSELQTDGSATTLFNNTSPPLLQSSAGGSTLEFEEGNGFITLRGFETLVTEDTDDQTYELAGDGKLTSSAFDGEVVYDITTNLEGNEGEPPGMGLVLVEGDDSAIRIVPIDATNVDLELDLDGDGTFDDADTITTTWAALEALAF